MVMKLLKNRVYAGHLNAAYVSVFYRPFVALYVCIEKPAKRQNSVIHFNLSLSLGFIKICSSYSILE